MSGFDQFAFMRAIRDDKRLGVVDKAVAGLSLFLRRNQETGQCDPSLPTICADSGVKDERTVVKAIETLVEYGYVRVVKVRGQRNKYALVNQEVPASDVPAFKVPAPKAPTKKVPTSDVPASDVPTSHVTRVPTSDVGGVPTSDVGRTTQITTNKTTNKALSKTELNFYGVPMSVILDWKQLRKNKKAVISQSVIDDLKKKADQMRALGHYEWNLEAIMREQVIRNWQGFRPEWVLGKGEQSSERPRLELTPEAKARRRAEALRAQQAAQRMQEDEDPNGVFEDLVGQVWEEVRHAS